MSHYETLGVAQDASDEEIKRAYKKLARKYHPDINPGEDAAEQFKKVSHAYEVLSDRERRANYDRFGDANGNAAPGFGGGGGFGGFDFGDIFGSFFGGGQRGPASRAQAGQDALIGVQVTLEEAVFGVTRSIDVRTAVVCETCNGSCCEPGTRPTTCDVCRGSGQIAQEVVTPLGRMQSAAPCGSCRGFGTVIKHPCVTCQGQGRVQERRSITIKVPGGIRTGNRIQLRGEGEAGVAGGPAGDLYVEIKVKPDSAFERDGDDLTTNIAVPMTTAALGAELTIDTFDGPQTVNVEAGTQSGTVRTLRGLGAKRLRNGVATEDRGDLRVVINVETPTKVKGRERELLEELARLRGEDKRSGTVRADAQAGGVFSRLRGKFGGGHA
ncbi:molecular chaperone DnaJ [Falsarthrobacter nasiphocae]|uniref:Chaperone protein DnaJ n=1 Tax=Falsarthrobacter nasiphocae TaxID=189863 RepID=A0AAE3YFI6_9MICC|nr:molecular chaperone DnaJ [Falsarthrobacter nasiphocae]MDR6891071.1 molecular chaperone DnaJ [Falsarthrobacter nasiphocae]